MKIDINTPLAALTVEQLISVLEGKGVPAPVPHENRRFVYGIRGIQDLFQCSHVTAQKMKDGILRDAVYQSGRKITVDVDKAMELVKNAKGHE